MKIFFCETFDDGTVGGSHACMYNLVRHMDRSKISCTVGFLGENVYVPKFRELGVPVIILPIRDNPVRSGNVLMRKAVNWYRLEYRAAKYLEDLFKREGFDIIVLNNSIYVSLLFVSVCKRMNLPVIVYERGFAPYKKKHIRASGDIDWSIPVSDAVYRNLMQCSFRSKRIERIYDGIDVREYTIPRDSASVKSELGLPIQSRVIGIIGNIRPWKGQKYFIDAFQELARDDDDLYGLIVGGWSKDDAGFVETLKNTLRERGLEDRVLFAGYRRDVAELLSVFDVFVHASAKPEPFGMVILEAMAAKKPVVATNMGGPVEILNNGECGALVPPKDGKAIAAACLKYFNDPIFRQSMVEKAYERLNRKFYIERTVVKTLSLFEKVNDSRYNKKRPVC